MLKRIAWIAALTLTIIVAGIAEDMTLNGMLPGVTHKPAAAQVPVVNTDHCATGLKQEIAFDINTATTTSLIAPVTGANVYICGMTYNGAAGTGTFALEYGTGSVCATGLTLMMGPITINTSVPNTLIVIPSSGNTQWMTSTTTPAPVISQRICAVTTGTVHQSGSLTFVQE